MLAHQNLSGLLTNSSRTAPRVDPSLCAERQPSPSPAGTRPSASAVSKTRAGKQNVLPARFQSYCLWKSLRNPGGGWKKKHQNSPVGESSSNSLVSAPLPGPPLCAWRSLSLCSPLLSSPPFEGKCESALGGGVLEEEGEGRKSHSLLTNTAAQRQQTHSSSSGLSFRPLPTQSPSVLASRGTHNLQQNAALPSIGALWP